MTTSIRINQFGKDAIVSSSQIVIAAYNAYMKAKYDDNYIPRKERDGFFVAIAYVQMRNSIHQIHYFIQAGKQHDGSAWIFTDIKNAIRSIKRIKKDAVIHILNDEEITQLIAKEKLESERLVEASRKLNTGDKADLINLLL